MTSTPPPPYQPPAGPTYASSGYIRQPLDRVPAVAWAVPLAALLAIIGAFTPWFHSSFVLDGQSHQLTHALYSWRDGRIGLVGPIALTVLSIATIRLLTGRSASFGRLGSHPLTAAARGAMILGAITLVCAVIAWFLVPSNYYFNTEQGRLSTRTLINDAHANGHTASLSNGPQVGYFLTVAAAVLAIVAGALMLVMRDKTAAAPATFGNPGWGAPPSPGIPGAFTQTAPGGGFAPPPFYSGAPAYSGSPSYSASSAPGAPAAPPPISGWQPPNGVPAEPATGGPAAAAPAGASDSVGWSSTTSYSGEQNDTESDGRVDLNK